MDTLLIEVLLIDSGSTHLPLLECTLPKGMDLFTATFLVPRAAPGTWQVPN